ncbi:MAG: Ger(x)C family spore germination protein [Heliobacteriaceae bacterium]|nr:Ger(x)C family spore germination protein [Heliobacteriaceae bacterium]
MGKIKRSFKLGVVVVCVALLLAGCTGKRELEDLGFVVAVGIDRDAAGEFTLTNQIFIAPSRFGPEGEKKTPFWVVTAHGKTVMDAARNMRSRSAAFISWHQARLYVIGEELAAGGMLEVIDFLVRNREVRKSAYMVIAKGMARDYLTISPEAETSIATETRRMIDNFEDWGGTVPLRMGEFLTNIYTPRTVTVFPLLGAGTPEPVIKTTGEAAQKLETGVVPEVLGSAVIQDERLHGVLSVAETRGYLLVQPKQRSRIPLVFSCPEEPERSITLELFEIKSRPKVVTLTPAPVFRITIQAKASLLEDDCSRELNPESLEQMEEMAAVTARQHVLAAWEKSQKIGADVLGLCRQLKAFYPGTWQQYQADWPQKLAQVALEVDVKVHITTTGTVSSGFAAEKTKNAPAGKR